MKKPWSQPTIREFDSLDEAMNSLAEETPNVQIMEATSSRYEMPAERGIYELPANRAGEHSIYALDRNGLIVGWERWTSLLDMPGAVERLKAMLEREDPDVIASAS